MNYGSGVCDGYLTMTNGTVTSPLFPQKYPYNADCVNIISSTPMSRIYIRIMKFETNPDDCLEIRDGSSSEAPLIGQFCGKNVSASFFETTQRYVWMRQVI